MNAPKMCPSCGTESIEPTFQYATLAVSFDRMHCTISGLHAYRCNENHFFIVIGGQADLEKSDAEPEDQACLCDGNVFPVACACRRLLIECELETLEES
jgi:hypothetical protein